MYTNIINKKVLIYTLGCKVNQYESDAMLENLTASGCLKAEDEENADICIVNTCSVTNMADRKSRQMIHRIKKKNPKALIVATGCYVQAAKDQILEEGYVDLIVGNNRKKDIARILDEFLTNQRAEDNFIDINATSEYEDVMITATTDHTRAYVKIQDGCNNFCSYCIIPYVRGRIRSKDGLEVIEEVTALAKRGIKEVVLTGINLSSYHDGRFSLLDIICRVSEIEGILRVRLGSLEPRVMTEEFLSVLSRNKKVCPHFHLSLQSACNETLKRMNRKYTIEEYMEKCNLIRKYYDRPAITTDVICGFPGETEEEFQTTYDNLVKLNLYEMHIFKYSRRKGTAAAGMKEQIDDRVKDERSNQLIELRNRLKKEYEASFTGESVDVLVEEIVEKEDGNKYFRGHTERYMRIDVKCSEVSEKPAEQLLNSIITIQYC